MKKVMLIIFLVSFSRLMAVNAFADSPHFIRNNLDGSQTLTGHMPLAVKNSTAAFKYHANQNISVQIIMPLQNQSQLDSLIQDLYDPKSPNYHHFLTPAQFAEQFAPSVIDTMAIRNFLNKEGISVAGQSSNGAVLNVTGPSGAFEHAFGLHINYYQKTDGTMFFAPDADPTIPVTLAGKISAVGGLDNLPKFRAHRQQYQMNALPKVSGSGPGGALAPSDIKTAYNLNSVPSNDAGQTIAVFELDGYKVSDITAYDTQFGLTLNTSLLSNVLIDGFSGTPNFTSQGGADEVELDIELLTAFAPGSNILVYEASNSIQSWIDEWTKIATDNKAKVVSCSWGEPEEDSPTIIFDNTIFAQMASQGQSVFVAAGDNGAYDGGGSTLEVDEPGSQPYATDVGISKLANNSSKAYVSEAASAYGGGGASAYWIIPSYQATAASTAVSAAKVSKIMRNVPDVVMTADASTPYAFYINGSWAGYYGSSISAPVWASFMSLVNHGLGANGPLGFANTWLYHFGASSDYANDFHDISTGNNGYYPAEAGFDDATGLGSFNGQNLYNDLVYNALAATLPGVPAGLSATAANGEVQLSWSASSGAVSYDVKRSTVSGGSYTTIATSVINTTYTDSSVTNGTTYYYVVLAVNTGGGQSANSSQVSATPTASVAPSITTQPASQTVTAPATATFTVVATGTPAPTYQWKQEASGASSYTAISGATSASYTTAATTVANSGTKYECVVTNSSGSATSTAATLTVNATPTAPAITTQPANETVTAPATATFTVVATGTPAPTYQWKQEASGASSYTTISGATSASYTTAATTVANSGTKYECVVTNSSGSATSTAATLTVNSTPIAPAITTQPANETVTAPATATFTVVATGTPAPTYQWKQEASGASSYTAISGATSASYTTPATTVANNGTKYECVVTNTSGSVTSNAAVLTVGFTITNLTVTYPAITSGQIVANFSSTQALTSGIVTVQVAAPSAPSVWYILKGNYAFVPDGGNNYTVSLPASAYPANTLVKIDNQSPQTVYYIVAASAGSNGTISLSGSVTLTSGTSQVYTLTPASGYTASLTVDGSPVTLSNNTYTLSSVASAHTLVASFTGLSITNVNVTYPASLSGQIVDNITSNQAITSANATVQVAAPSAPSVWYTLKGNYAFISDGNNTYTVSLPANAYPANTLVKIANQSPQTVYYALAASAGSNGAINPSGSVILTSGASQIYTLTPASGYTATLTEDGNAVTLSDNTYTLSSVTSSHTLVASFVQTSTLTNLIVTYPASLSGQIVDNFTSTQPLIYSSVVVQVAAPSAPTVWYTLTGNYAFISNGSNMYTVSLPASAFPANTLVKINNQSPKQSVISS